MFEVDEDGTILRSVFIDGIEPEDARLGRDLDVFVSEINRLAKERNDLAKAVENLTEISSAGTQPLGVNLCCGGGCPRSRRALALAERHKECRILKEQVGRERR